MKPLRQVRVLINPRAGQGVSFDHLRAVMDRAWDRPGIDLTYQFSHSIADGKRKTRRAVAQGVDTILAVGGDGMVNSIGGELVGKPVAFGVVPVGSGNGFARHFGIPLNPEKAVTALFESERCAIDVGTANGSPFFVTCSMAWDATVASGFCRVCHSAAFDELAAGSPKHRAIPCAVCHREKHKAIPVCGDCHGRLHPAPIMARFPTCGACHHTAHALNHWPEKPTGGATSAPK